MMSSWRLWSQQKHSGGNTNAHVLWPTQHKHKPGIEIHFFLGASNGFGWKRYVFICPILMSVREQLTGTSWEDTSLLHLDTGMKCFHLVVKGQRYSYLIVCAILISTVYQKLLNLLKYESRQGCTQTSCSLTGWWRHRTVMFLILVGFKSKNIYLTMSVHCWLPGITSLAPGSVSITFFRQLV